MQTCASDENLMQLVAQGDLDAFGQLVLRHQQMAWRTAYRLVADYQAAEDIAQDAFLRILDHADCYQPTAAFRSYLYRIVVRRCLDYLRKGRPIPTNDLGRGIEDTSLSSSPEQQVAHDELTQAVQDALARIPASHRTAIVLRYFEGLSGREIADVMETTVKAVERLLARGRASLERLLSGFLDE
ncbi:MAG: sigma-70 family RNA polymerase sigma factor [Planctomycetes bacterium]|nr:sigma-70 family RNA polymerase sigma factor [Planctomycetota bacterium]MBL7044189.1 sigma-70 family RNA polymerase sigma factor [Pirellulaceae bacterium]